MRKANPYIGAVGRLLIAALFLISGLGKIAAPALTQGFITSAGLPFPLLASVFDTKTILPSKLSTWIPSAMPT